MPTFHRYPGQNAAEFEAFCQHVREFRPRSILEVGSRQGRSLVRLCEAAMPGLQRVTVMDIPGGPWGASDSRPDLEACCDHLRSRGVKVDLHWLDSQSDEAGVVAAGLEEHDLIFIDADHSLAAVRHDFERFFPVLAPQGWLAFHDVNGRPDFNSQGRKMGVPLLWNELKASGNYECREFIDRKAAYGIGLLRRQGKIEIRGRRVAIVGNAPHALENIEDIDAFDVVARINRFRTGPGFEAVGARTDLWITYGGRVVEEATRDSSGGARMVLLLDEPAPRKRRILARQKRRTVARLHALFPGQLVEAWDMVGKVRRQLDSPSRPTTGLAGIAWVLEQQPAEIYLTGFSFETGGEDHYFPDPEYPFCDKTHSRDAELLWLAALAGDPVFRFDEHIHRKLDEVEFPPRQNR